MNLNAPMPKRLEQRMRLMPRCNDRSHVNSMAGALLPARKREQHALETTDKRGRRYVQNGKRSSNVGNGARRWRLCPLGGMLHGCYSFGFARIRKRLQKRVMTRILGVIGTSRPEVGSGKIHAPCRRQLT